MTSPTSNHVEVRFEYILSLKMELSDLHDLPVSKPTQLPEQQITYFSQIIEPDLKIFY